MPIAVIVLLLLLFISGKMIWVHVTKDESKANIKRFSRVFEWATNIIFIGAAVGIKGTVY